MLFGVKRLRVAQVLALGLFLALGLMIKPGKSATEPPRVTPSPKYADWEENRSIELRDPSWDIWRVRDKFSASLDSIQYAIERAVAPNSDNRIGKSIPIRAYIGGAFCSFSEQACASLRHPEGYVVRVDSMSIQVMGSDSLGVLHGLTSLQALVEQTKGDLPLGHMASWPTHKIRAFHFVLRNITVEDALRMVGWSREAQMNTLVIQIADGVSLPSLEGVARSNAWTEEDFQWFAQIAREHGLQIVPEVKFLTHQEKLFAKSAPELLYNPKTYDPRKEEVYERVKAIVDDLDRVLHPQVIHIGHDEAWGVGTKSVEIREQKGEPLPPSLFLRDVQRLHRMLGERGISTWMWADMLLQPDELGNAFTKHLRATADYAALRGSIPKDIVLCDWQYYGSQTHFPSARILVRAGFDVLGSTWKNETNTHAFSRYVALLSSGGRGMIATSWFHVQREEWQIVSNILKTSGEAFWNSEK